MKDFYLKIMKIRDGYFLPIRMSKDAAGYDLRSIEDYTLLPYERYTFNLGFITEFPSGYVGEIYPRSGLAINDGIVLANFVAIIDSDYRGEWKVALYNSKSTPYPINYGDRIAQVVFHRHYNSNIEVVDRLSPTERNDNGLGSTGR